MAGSQLRWCKTLSLPPCRSIRWLIHCVRKCQPAHLPSCFAAATNATGAAATMCPNASAMTGAAKVVVKNFILGVVLFRDGLRAVCLDGDEAVGMDSCTTGSQTQALSAL